MTCSTPTIFHSSITTSRGEGEEQWYTRPDEAPQEGRNSSDPCSAPQAGPMLRWEKKCTWIKISDFPVLASETLPTSSLWPVYHLGTSVATEKTSVPPSTWSWSSSLCFLCCCLVDRKVTCDLAVEATPAVVPPHTARMHVFMWAGWNRCGVCVVCVFLGSAPILSLLASVAQWLKHPGKKKPNN